MHMRVTPHTHTHARTHQVKSFTVLLDEGGRAAFPVGCRDVRAAAPTVSVVNHGDEQGEGGEEGNETERVDLKATKSAQGKASRSLAAAQAKAAEITAGLQAGEVPSEQDVLDVMRMVDVWPTQDRPNVTPDGRKQIHGHTHIHIHIHPPTPNR